MEGTGASDVVVQVHVEVDEAGLQVVQAGPLRRLRRPAVGHHSEPAAHRHEARAGPVMVISYGMEYRKRGGCRQRRAPGSIRIQISRRSGITTNVG